MKNKDLFIMKTRVPCYPCQIGNLQVLIIKSMEKKHKTVKGGNFILRISVIRLLTSDMGHQVQFPFLFEFT